MKIYIASSWKNQHGVEMLTAILRDKWHEVISWIENNFGEMKAIKSLGFDEWIETEGAQKSFDFDTNGAMNCDLLIYYAPSGKDAAAEVGMAYAKGITIIGLYAKGEDFGLMRKMCLMWFNNYRLLVNAIQEIAKAKE